MCFCRRRGIFLGSASRVHIVAGAPSSWRLGCLTLMWGIIVDVSQTKDDGRKGRSWKGHVPDDLSGHGAWLGRHKEAVQG